MKKRTTTNQLAQNVDHLTTTVGDLTTTVDDLAIMMQTGFDEHGKQIANLTVATKEGFEKHDKRFDAQDKQTAELKNEVFQNGDALAKFIIRFEDESAANLTAHERIETRLERMEHKTDTRLNRIEHHLNLSAIPFPTD